MVGLVGPNGAGKSTLLNLAVGLLSPTAGTITVLGGRPGSGQAQLDKVGFVAQDAPIYAGQTVAQHLKMGSYCASTGTRSLPSPGSLQLDLDPDQKAGSLSGGQRAQLALTMAIAKRPDLLVLDEPVAGLDPLARREFLQVLMEEVAAHGASVVLSSHLIEDLGRVCDYLVILADSRVRLTGDVSDLLAEHRRISGPRRQSATLPSGQVVIEESHTDKQSTFLVRTAEPILDPVWTVKPVSLEDLVLAYLSQSRKRPAARTNRLEAIR